MARARPAGIRREGWSRRPAVGLSGSLAPRRFLSSVLSDNYWELNMRLRSVRTRCVHALGVCMQGRMGGGWSRRWGKERRGAVLAPVVVRRRPDEQRVGAGARLFIPAEQRHTKPHPRESHVNTQANPLRRARPHKNSSNHDTEPKHNVSRRRARPLALRVPPSPLPPVPAAARGGRDGVLLLRPRGSQRQPRPLPCARG
jgi:hypothetical protein